MRKHYLDNIRWGTVLLVLLFHVFYLYNNVGALGGIGAITTAQHQDIFEYIVYPWFMALLFLVAGMSARYSLMSRTSKEFIRSRTVKLLVPSTLGLFVYQWITGYFNVKAGGAMAQIPVAIRYPVFVMSGIGPLWFIQMLYLFSLILVLIRHFDKKDTLWTWGGKCGWPVLLGLVLPVWGAAQILNTPVLIMYRFGIYFFLFLLGYFVFSHDEVQDRVEKMRWPLLIVTVALAVGYTLYYFGTSYASLECLKSLFTNVYLWAAILAILGCGKAWLDKTTPRLTYLTRAGFGWYILHYPIVITVCYVLKNNCHLPAVATYIVAIVAEFILTPLIYELFRRIPIVRYLVLGIKKEKTKKTA